MLYILSRFRCVTLSIEVPYKRDPRYVIPVSANDMAPNGAKRSADTVPDKERNMSTSKFHKQSIIPYHLYGVIQYGPQDLAQSRRTLYDKSLVSANQTAMITSIPTKTVKPDETQISCWSSLDNLIALFDLPVPVLARNRGIELNEYFIKTVHAQLLVTALT